MKYPMLERLDDGRVFYIKPDKEGFLLVEGCDAYFGVLLTKDELMDLAFEIMRFAAEGPE